MTITCDRCRRDMSTVADLRGIVTSRLEDYREEGVSARLPLDLCRDCWRVVDAAINLALQAQAAP